MIGNNSNLHLHISHAHFFFNIRYIEIPGEKKVVNTFKFDMNLPPPIPQPKTLYITFDPDRYIKPKLTLLTVKKKPTVLTDINLSINQLDVNTEPEKFNPEKGASKYYIYSENKLSINLEG